MAGQETLTQLDPSGENVDPNTFGQILEMDDDEEERDFSRGIVYGFFEQAEETIKKLDKAIANKDLEALSSLGHFLKGSSATLGLSKVRDSCEKIQHFGQGKDAAGNPDQHDSEYFLNLIGQTTQRVREDYATAEKILKKFFKDE
ncbi:uncharacterized protein KY384_004258 [Bacidia gigantensis]|uniref:uncharacterized protein n=1 Tax=Bacidia gigantensis TaxID=2732470 RepID=UPI001D05A5A5|nr:uncharacterized protein KY384_004258 [Bacidia gigantensis]KAG8530901.1 hypothetical protein KY384_004258 [Bacidia gigantensis]